MAESFFGEGKSIYVDLSDVERMINLLRGLMRQEQFERLMHRTFNEAGKRSKVLIAREVYKDYAVTQKWVKSQIEHYKLSFGGGAPVNCEIPIRGKKGVLGRSFKAKELRKGISAKIVKTGRSRLPPVMEHQGGNPPFMAKAGERGFDGAGAIFTRRTKARLPIVKVVGLGVPQMPLNRSADKVSYALLDYVGERLEHNFFHMLGSGR